jgi:TolA-binding protein
MIASASTAAPLEAATDAASTLFADANRERRQAHAATAIALYGELQRVHPGSEEAHVSHVSLGRLLLERGASSEAMSQLDQYLTTSPDGLLAPEALFGKAQALKALGRRDEERSTWTRLLTQFADSVYGAQARRRLEELR